MASKTLFTISDIRSIALNEQDELTRALVNTPTNFEEYQLIVGKIRGLSLMVKAVEAIVFDGDPTKQQDYDN